MPASSPEIVQYAEYRVYLKDRYAAMKRANAKFSHRYINGKCGASSSGWFSDILAGRQRLKPAQTRAVAAVFKMDAREHDFLSALVDIERADNPESRIAAMERWLSLKGPRREAIGKDRFAFFDHWYHLVLREVLGILPFDGNYEALGAALQPPITGKQAREALDLLQRLGVIMPQIWNRRLSDLPVLVKSPDGEAKHWYRILKDMMRLAPDALDRYPKSERDFSALTLSLSPAGFAKAGEAIAELRKKLLLIAEKDRGQNRIYQVLFQMFPVSKPLDP